MHFEQTPKLKCIHDHLGESVGLEYAWYLRFNQVGQDWKNQPF